MIREALFTARAMTTAALLLGSSVAAPAQAPAGRPNIVFILSDDEDVAINAFMTRSRPILQDAGATFANAFVTYPLCGPSRTSILTGLYPHNTGILGNEPPLGGFRTFRRLGGESETVATWLQAAGYRTAFYGKYLNGYGATDAPAPGWDEWHAGNNHGYGNFDYELNENGEVVAYGHEPADYLTDVIAGKAASDIRRWAEAGDPFFLYVSPFSIHSPYVPAPRHAGSEATAALPRPPSFLERDMRDKPLTIAGLPLLDDSQIAILTEHYRGRRESLKSVEDLIETLVTTLGEVGELDNTYVVYMSDNGFHMGLHRMMEGKHTPYEEDIRVPLAIRGPGIAPGVTVEGMALNIDMAPTFADMAGIEPGAPVDGRSLLPLLRTPDMPWRKSFLVQRMGLESNDRQRFANALALRTGADIYIAYEDGERELYDLRTDPNELDNGYESADPTLIAELSNRLINLTLCRAEECGALENAPFESR